MATMATVSARGTLTRAPRTSPAIAVGRSKPTKAKKTRTRAARGCGAAVGSRAGLAGPSSAPVAMPARSMTLSTARSELADGERLEPVMTKPVIAAAVRTITNVLGAPRADGTRPARRLSREAAPSTVAAQASQPAKNPAVGPKARVR